MRYRLHSSRHGWNASQVQRYLGHHKPSFNLDAYVHLLDSDVPEPVSMESVVAGDPPEEGNERATKRPKPLEIEG